MRLSDVFVLKEMYQPKFKEGQLVRLRGYPVGHPDFPEGLPEEVGRVVEVERYKEHTREQFYVVELLRPGKEGAFGGPGYDEVEVEEEQIEPLKAGAKN